MATEPKATPASASPASPVADASPQGQREIRLDHGKVVKETWHDHDFEQRASGLVLPGRDGDARSGKDKVR